MAEDHPGSSWASLPLGWLHGNGGAASYDENDLSSGLLMLICGDVIRPRMAWMVTRAHRHLAPVMAEVRDPAGFARLRELAESGPPSTLKDARLATTRPVAVGQGDQLLAAVGAHADHHQQAQLVLLQPDVHVDPVRPHVHVVHGGQVPGGERALLGLPRLGQPGDHRAGQARRRAEELAQRGHEVPGRQAV